MRLNVVDSALTSSPPDSLARTSVRPSPSARAASSRLRSRWCVGRKITSAMTAAPTPSSAMPIEISVGAASRKPTDNGGSCDGTATTPIRSSLTVM